MIPISRRTRLAAVVAATKQKVVALTSRFPLPYKL